MTLKSLIAVVTIAFGVTPAFAEGHGQVVNDIYVPGNTPGASMPVLIHSYHGQNFCPTGLQPVTLGGVVSCGAPTASAYVDHPGRVAHPAPSQHRPHTPTAMAVEGEKGVIYQ